MKWVGIHTVKQAHVSSACILCFDAHPASSIIPSSKFSIYDHWLKSLGLGELSHDHFIGIGQEMNATIGRRMRTVSFAIAVL